VRGLADAERIRRFMRELGSAADAEATVYLTGGATAVLVGWRPSTIDVDINVEPESDTLLRAIQRLKNTLDVNVELAAPSDFIPVPDGWAERSPFVAREGQVTFRHFDPYAQALAKLERGHQQDLEDVHALVKEGLVEPGRALAYFEEVEPLLHRYPAIDPRAFRRRVEAEFAP
jgi:uncharacterized nucleotidyltransferase DUF6036